MNTNQPTSKTKREFIRFSMFIIVLILLIYGNNNAISQCKPMIKIDGNATVVNTNDDFGLNLPFWLTENQTLAIGSSVSSISVVEFSVVSGNTLEFSKVINVTSTTGVTVPTGKVWKIESIAKLNNSSTYKSATFGAGTFTWKVPACAEQICIDMWGAGGGGGASTSSSAYYGGGGGGGGGYGSQCFAVTPGDTYTVIVGSGGTGGTGAGAGTNGGNSSVSGTGISMTVTGGTGGGGGTTSAGGTGGTGGTSTASSNAQGANGNIGCNVRTTVCGAGGAGANGGAGGLGQATAIAGNPGVEPGGGGGGGPYGGSNSYAGGKGGDGRIIISW